MRYNSTRSQSKKAAQPSNTQLTLNLLARNKGFTLWAVTSLISGIVGLSGVFTNPYVTHAATTAFGSAQAAALITSEKNKYIARLEKAERADRSKFESEQKQLIADRAALQKHRAELDKIAAAQAATQVTLQTRAETYQDKIRAEVTMKLRAESDRVIKEAQTVAARSVAQKQKELDDAIAACDAMRSEFAVKYDQTKQIAAGAIKKAQADKQALGDKAAETIQIGNEVLVGERNDVNKVLERLSDEIQILTSELASQKEMVAKLQAPKQFKFKSYEADTGNQIQQFLSARGVVLSCDSIGKVHYGLTPIFYEAINCDASEVKAQLEALQLHLGLMELPTVEVVEGKLKITVQLSADSTPKADKELVIVDPPLSALENAINDSIHLRIVAQSGSGKTVLLGNLINYLTQHVSSDYVLSDPKVTAPENWGNLQPAYYSRECLTHFFNLTETCLTRIDEAAESVKATGKLPDFEMQFHVIDELEFLYGLSEVSTVKEYNSKLFKINGKSMLKVGREHKMKLLFVTQSPLPSDLNLRRNDFENCSSIFLGSQISAGLSSTDGDGLLKDASKERIAKLKAEHRARLARGDKWIYLFFNPAQPEEAFIGRCPSPGHYAALAQDKIGPARRNDASRFSGFEGVAHCPVPPTQNAATLAGQSVQSSREKSGNEDSRAEVSNNTGLAQGSTGLASLLAQGTHCPNCGTHSASYKNKRPTRKGEVTLRCKTKGCASKGTFKWKVV